MDQAQVDLESSLADVNLTKVRADLGSASQGATDGVNASLVNDVVDLKTTLLSAKLDNDTVQAYRSLSTVWNQAVAALTAELTFFDSFHKGVCSSDPTIQCEADTDCPSPDTCDDRGTRHCAASPSTSCADNSGCTAPDECNVDPTRTGAVSGLLSGLENNRPDTSAVSAATQDAEDQFSGVSFADLQSDINGTIDSIESIDTAALTADLDGVRGQTAAPGLASTRASLVDVNATVQDVDFAAQREAIDDMDEQITDVRDNQLDQARDVIDFVDVLQELVEEKIPQYARRLSPARMGELREQGGLSAVFLEVMLVADDMTRTLANRSSLLPIEKPTSLANDTSSVTDILELFDDPAFLEAGSVYFLATIADRAAGGIGTPLINHTDARAKYVQTDASGEAYPDDAMCLTDACIRNDNERFHTEPLADGPLGLPIPLSRETLVSLPYLIVAIFAVVGMLACLAPIMCESPQWQKVPSACFAGCSLGFAPCMLIFGALFLPLVMVFRDTCAGMPNVAHQYVKVSGRSLCAGTLDGTGDASLCSSNMSLGLGGDPIPVTYRPLDTISALFDGCDPAEDPLRETFAALGSGLSKAVSSAADEMLEGDTGFELRGPMQAILTRAARGLGVSAGQLVTSLHEDVLRCDRVHGTVAGFKEALCCEVLDSVYWLVSPWILMGLVLLCLGTPCGLLARKRIPSSPWGTAYDEEVERVKAAQAGIIGLGGAGAGGGSSTTINVSVNSPGSGGAEEFAVKSGTAPSPSAPPAPSTSTAPDADGKAMYANPTYPATRQ